jgi:hypothetical protein
MKIAGYVLIITGLMLAIYSAFDYFTRVKIVDVGTIELKSQPNYFIWSPFIGLAIMVIGAFVILQARKK